MNAGIESTFANHSLIKQLLEPFRLLSRHTPDLGEKDSRCLINKDTVANGRHDE